MKIKVTRRIELNGKTEEKSAEAEIGVSPWDHARTSEKTARALFEGMNPPMVAVNAPCEPNAKPEDFTKRWPAPWPPVSKTTSEVIASNTAAYVTAISTGVLPTNFIKSVHLSDEEVKAALAAWTPRLKLVLATAKKVAEDYGLHYVGMESLLIAMIRIKDGTHSSFISWITEEAVAEGVGLKKAGEPVADGDSSDAAAYETWKKGSGFSFHGICGPSPWRACWDAALKHERSKKEAK